MAGGGTARLEASEVELLRNLARALQDLVVYLVESNLGEISIEIGKKDHPVKSIADKYRVPLDTLLEEGVKRGFLKAFPADKLVFCPKCGGFSFKVRYACPNCGSFDVERNTLFSHVTCGFIGVLEEAPRTVTGKVQCPKCKRELVREGDDWVKLSSTWRCRSCGTSFSYPVASLECASCGERFDDKRAEYRAVMRYSVDKKAVSEAFSQIFNKRVAEVLASQGYVVKPAAEATAMSGVTRKASLIAEKRGVRLYVHNIFPREGNVESAKDEVFNVYGSALDDATRRIIVAVNTPTQVARRPENVETIEGRSLEEAIRKLQEKLRGEK
ncbi:TackOD1 domain-containing metal-binding protein [Thermofilum pendens]|uniref:Thaumarchaeal output domain-containing protein n=1 Tax=Thermofilum pendens (strain DSM 2475 / Hrk 5) TaxID=368408 RepID=A1RYC8_THEPD|nr:hypothetical protein [Thermofilum pendens]ABL78208.1 hypothetical protein Tpen_0807 [Thermofilum pendens Hrk 5]